MSDKEPITMNTKPVYNPGNQYHWPNEAKFELTGEQFGLWLNSVRAKVMSKEASEFQQAFRANEEIEKIMAANVASGVIVELPKAEGQPKK